MQLARLDWTGGTLVDWVDGNDGWDDWGATYLAR